MEFLGRRWRSNTDSGMIIFPLIKGCMHCELEDEEADLPTHFASQFMVPLLERWDISWRTPASPGRSCLQTRNIQLLARIFWRLDQKEGNNLEERKRKWREKIWFNENLQLPNHTFRKEELKNILRTPIQEEAKFGVRKFSIKKWTHVFWSTIKMQSYFSWQEVDWFVVIVVLHALKIVPCAHWPKVQ